MATLRWLVVLLCVASATPVLVLRGVASCTSWKWTTFPSPICRRASARNPRAAPTLARYFTVSDVDPVSRNPRAAPTLGRHPRP